MLTLHSFKFVRLVTMLAVALGVHSATEARMALRHSDGIAVWSTTYGTGYPCGERARYPRSAEADYLSAEDFVEPQGPCKYGPIYIYPDEALLRDAIVNCVGYGPDDCRAYS
jgi:hypothetical protein